MKLLITYLKKNWKHISIGAVIAIYNILVQSGVIPAQYEGIINSILTALGLFGIKNSGTTDAINKAKAPIIVIALMLSVFTAHAQATAYTLTSPYQMYGIRGTAGDTVTNSGTGYDSIRLDQPYNSAAIECTVTKISGTVSPTLYVEASVDGNYWTKFGQDTLVLSNVTGTTGHFWMLPGLPQISNTTGSTQYQQALPILPFLWYRVYVTGTGTMSCIIKSYISPR